MCCFLGAASANAASIINATGTSVYTLLQDTTGQASQVPGLAAVTTARTSVWSSIPGAQWIAPDADQSSATRGPMRTAGTTVYQTTFDLTNFDISTAQLNGQILSDESVTAYLNGHLIYTGRNWVTPQSLTDLTSSDFIQGLNTLTFTVVNTGGATGLDVLFTVSDSAATPEPGTATPVATVLLGGCYWAGRRRTQT